MEERDLETILGWRNRDDVRVWFKTSDKITFTGHVAWYNSYLQKEDDYFFMVEADGKSVGQCAIYGVDIEAGSAEIGRFIVAPGMAGKGYISHSCAELMKFGTGVLNLSYLFLEVLERNEKAIRLYARRGFVEESRSGGLVRMGFAQGGGA
ncbi:GNAT family N-acetyltransferase [Mesorhizobium sp. INR15]|nr:GNAT family N-acetyltransferase [Mesorhizobium sp. INR15]